MGCYYIISIIPIKLLLVVIHSEALIDNTSM